MKIYRKCDGAKRLRHLRGVWERRLIEAEILKNAKKKSKFGFATMMSIIGKKVAYKVSVLSRKYRIPKCYRRKEHSRLNG